MIWILDEFCKVVGSEKGVAEGQVQGFYTGCKIQPPIFGWKFVWLEAYRDIEGGFGSLWSSMMNWPEESVRIYKIIPMSCQKHFRLSAYNNQEKSIDTFRISGIQAEINKGKLTQREMSLR